MQNYTYTAEFEHGSATGEIQAKNANEAKTKVKDMYHDNQYDTKDSKGNPIVKKIVVTKITVTIVKG